MAILLFFSITFRFYVEHKQESCTQKKPWSLCLPLQVFSGTLLWRCLVVTLAGTVKFETLTHGSFPDLRPWTVHLGNLLVANSAQCRVAWQKNLVKSASSNVNWRRHFINRKLEAPTRVWNWCSTYWLGMMAGVGDHARAGGRAGHSLCP